MPIQRNHSRRRRVFLDESVQSEMLETIAPATSKSTRANSKNIKVYSDAAKREGQLKTTDLFPKRNVMIGSIIGCCLIFVALLNYLAINASAWSEVLSADAVRTISFSGTGSVSSWFSSFLLLMTSMASLQIYSMRRHRNDDYDGTYRVWLWLAVLFVVASVNCVVDFKSVFHSLAATAGYPLGQNILLLIGIKFFALNIIVIRGLLEIRQSRSAIVTVVLAWVAYTSALAAQYPFEQIGLSQHQDLILGNSVLVGTISSFAMSMIFARFIYLHANELVVVKPKSKVQVADDTKSQTTASQIALDKPIAVLQSNTKTVEMQVAAKQTTKAAAVKSKTATDEQVQEILSLEESQQLSKSERRRMNKLQKRQRRAA